jgi:hypothetical protein
LLFFKGITTGLFGSCAMHVGMFDATPAKDRKPSNKTILIYFYLLKIDREQVRNRDYQQLSNAFHSMYSIFIDVHQIHFNTSFLIFLRDIFQVNSVCFKYLL